MSLLSRRAFGMAALATAPLLLGARSTKNPVKIGVQTFSFRDMLTTRGEMVDKMIDGMHALGLDFVELFEPTIQPVELVMASVSSPQMQAAIFGRPPAEGPTDEQIALREKIRGWRLGTPMTYFTGIRRRFEDAGIRIQAFNFNLKEYCTDDEVARGFEITRALGTDVMTTSTTLRMAQRTVPFAERHGVRLGVHGHTNLQDSNEFATPQSFERALAMSPRYCVNLDIGHFSAAGFDPVAFIEKHHARVVSIHLKDRKKNAGPYTHFGEGDTPIIPVIKLIRDRGWPIAMLLEYEYEGGPSVQELRTCLAYIQEALA